MIFMLSPLFIILVINIMAVSNRPSRGRGRGILALTSYDPCPRPKNLSIPDTRNRNQEILHSADARKPVNIVKPLPATNAGKNVENANSPVLQKNKSIKKKGFYFVLLTVVCVAYEVRYLILIYIYYIPQCHGVYT